jgi:hypothetical protein
VVNYSSWAFISLNVPFRSIRGMLAHRDEQGRTGPPSCGTMHKIPGRVISCKLQTSSFARVAATSGIKMLTTPCHAPRANAICERFLGSVRRECLAHLFILRGEAAGSCPAYLCPVLQSSQAASRIKQQLPEQYGEPVQPDHDGGRSSPFRSWVDYTTIIAEVLELLRVCKEADGSVGGSASAGKSHTVSPFLPFFSDECTKQEVFAPS